MLRILVLLLVVGGLTLFLLSNPTPIPLVILGIRTVSVPLSVWVLGAIGAGALTTLFFAGILQVSNLFTTPRSRPKANRGGDRPLSTSQQAGGWMPQEPEPVDSVGYATSRATATSNPRDNDWTKVGRNPDEWEDWSGYPEPDQASIPEPPYYQPSYSEPSYSEPAYADPQTARQDPDISEPTAEEWDDWDYEGEARRHDTDYETERNDRSSPIRTDFERQQEPRSTYRSGSIYSYSYRDSEDSGVGKTENVYDADYRVIKPPSQPDPEDDELEPFAAAPSEDVPSDAEDWQQSDEDWGFEEDFEEDESDRPRRDR